VSTITKADLQKYFQHLIQRGRQGLGVVVDDTDIILTYINDITNKLDTANKQTYGEDSFFHESEAFKATVYRDILLTALHYVLESDLVPYQSDFPEKVTTLTDLDELNLLAHTNMDASKEFTFVFWKGVILGYKIKCEEFYIKPDIAHTAVISMEIDPTEFTVTSPELH